MKQPSIGLSMPNNYRHNGKELNEGWLSEDLQSEVLDELKAIAAQYSAQ